ncbi:hypothetical protein [Nitrospira sp. KM1]|uniref:hypothetical protein n=1 Tax=Nitrospira sp. KM1 TaxID=1936990 RepID=UPI001566E56A|nr:hypothetical protein [Nitrospira sp. KM1]
MNTTNGKTASSLHHNGNGRIVRTSTVRKRRVTITLPATLLDRMRNAVYWTGTIPLAQLITDALERTVNDMELINGGTFPARLAPLKRGRPRLLRLIATQRPPAPQASMGTSL